MSEITAKFTSLAEELGYVVIPMGSQWRITLTAEDAEALLEIAKEAECLPVIVSHLLGGKTILAIS